MNREVLRDLEEAILGYNSELAVISARRVVEEGVDLNKTLEAMTEAIRQVEMVFKELPPN